ncbi:hypothetical protein C8R32_1242 [Nitrosospira sp. Nsp5]|uniref:Uncharacterized protein n=1 Tax=Nitrosospira multiformis TaxID=1231 RepID=A0ABY0TIZ5_9PROT|nr:MULTISPECIES: hypothetical protein [Nitrosospira]PTR05298.1 hypothetical protein C8R32_1242 [Nitrosospira sp. Nsp5]SDQ91391.1 hypothetical protein SAMN05216402_2800 [Nitrosospira multiformis]
MTLLPQTKDFLSYLQKNPGMRSRIAAPPNTTLLYAGIFIKPMWQELEQLKHTNRDVASKHLLPDVLARIQTPSQTYPTLLAWAKALDGYMPWKENGFIAWRALSGIFAANAVGTVSFCIGSNVAKGEKVFSATELPVLLRNPNVDALTKDILSYYQRCIQTGDTAINFGFVGG